MPKMQGVRTYFFKVFISAFNSPCRNSNHNRIIRNISCYNSTRSNNNPVSNVYARKNNNIVSNINIISNRNGLGYFQIRDIFSENQNAAIMCNKLYAICNIHIFSNRNNPWLASPSDPSVDVKFVLFKIYAHFLSVFHGIDF